MKNRQETGGRREGAGTRRKNVRTQSGKAEMKQPGARMKPGNTGMPRKEDKEEWKESNY